MGVGNPFYWWFEGGGSFVMFLEDMRGLESAM